MTNEAPRILVVTDDLGMARRLLPTLSEEGYKVEATRLKHAPLAAIERHRPHLTVIDEPPRRRDTTIQRIAMRARHYGPILPLLNAVPALGSLDGRCPPEASAVSKPFSVYELMLQIRARLRDGRQAVLPEPSLQVADLEIDERLRSVSRGGAPIALTPTEFRLLHLLVARSPRVLSRSQIVDLVWSYAYLGSDAVVETYVSYLRHKIDVPGPGVLQTFRGVGYGIRSVSR